MTNHLINNYKCKKRKDKIMKSTIKQKVTRKIIYSIMFSLIITGFLFQIPAEAKNIGCKSLCGVVLKASGGAKELEYQSDNALDFGALSASDRKKIKNIQYICDSKEVYSLCVLQAKNATGAKSLLKHLQKYKKNNCSSDYLQDYSSTEQNVFKNAICGRKGNYVWYIAVSDTKQVNIDGQKAIKKKL